MKNSGEQHYILDSYALLAFLEGEAAQTRVQELLRSAEAGKSELFMCIINLGEVLYIIERERGLRMAQQVQGLIETLPIHIIESSNELVFEAAHIKANYKISYADAFVVASAKREAAIILTGDPEFKSVEKLVTVEWLER